MGPENGVNLNKFDYFSIEEYVRRIKVEDFVLEHMEDTNRKFDDYLTEIAKCDDYTKIYYFLDSINNEIISSHKMEKHYISNKDILENDCFFSSLQMSHASIKRIHNLVMKDNTDYRSGEVRVSSLINDEEKIYWYGAKSEDVKLFMDDFIKFYKTKSLSVIDSNPFLKSALAHLLFVRIHPFSDGNGRTARMIHNMKFTDRINNAYGMNLKICPLNISQSILLNQPTYVKRINDIYFDLEHDSNYEINKWFDFILNMSDDQLHFNTVRLPKFQRLVASGGANKKELNRPENKEMKKEVEKLKVLK